jgi:hypothetical protein
MSRGKLLKPECGNNNESNSLLDTVLLEAGPCARRDQLRGCQSVNYSYRATTLVSLVSVSDGK